MSGTTSARRVSYIRQSGKGVTATASDAATNIRRSTTGLFPTRDAFQSNEKRIDRQKADSGLGTKKLAGPIEGEAFIGAWKDFQESLVSRDWTAVTTIAASSGDGFTIVGSTGVLTRAAGGSQSFLTDGLVAGLVVKFTAFDTGIDGRFFYVSAVTATTATLVALDGLTIPDVSVADTNATLVIPGKYTYIPSSGFTQHYYTIEDYFSNLSTDACLLGTDVCVDSATLTIGVNAFCTWSWGMLGTGQVAKYSGGSAPYFSNVTAVGTEKAFRASAVWFLMDGEVAGTVTAATLQINRQGVAPAVIRNDQISPDVFPGDFMVQMTNLALLLEDLSFYDKLDGETEFPMAMVMQLGSQFFAINLGRGKLTSLSLGDNAPTLDQTVAVDLLKSDAATGTVSTTLMFQDSSIS